MEEGVEPFTTYEVKLTTDAMANTSAIFFQIKGKREKERERKREREREREREKKEKKRGNVCVFYIYFFICARK